MHRFLVQTDDIHHDTVVLAGDAARHLKVVRPRPGEAVELFDGKGTVRTYRVDASVLTAIGEPRSCPPSPLRLTLFACVTKGSRWDWTIEKAVELGVSRIVPVVSDRCIVRLDPAERDAKAERWRRIAADAARQSDAAWLPEVCRAVDFHVAAEEVRACGTVFAGVLADPPPPPLQTALAEAVAGGCEAGLGFFVGPEGDFSPEELQVLRGIAIPVSLGPTILRAETAAVFGLSVIAAAAHAMLARASVSSGL